MNKTTDQDRFVAKDRIFELLDHFDINQSEFASDLEISHSYVSGILAGTKTPSKKLIRAIKKKYEVLDLWWKTGEGQITERDPSDMFYREPDQNKELIKLFENTFSPEFMTVIVNLTAELDDASPEFRYAAVSLLNKYIKTGLNKDVLTFLGDHRKV